MASIGDRLREERLRLGKNQPEFAALGHAAKRSQIRYESGEKSPDAEYLAGIVEAGADVHYIITGERRAPPPGAFRADVLRGVIEGVEETLGAHRQRLTPVKKAELIALLYEQFARAGQVDNSAIGRFLKLVA